MLQRPADELASSYYAATHCQDACVLAGKKLRRDRQATPAADWSGGARSGRSVTDQSANLPDPGAACEVSRGGESTTTPRSSVASTEVKKQTPQCSSPPPRPKPAERGSPKVSGISRKQPALRCHVPHLQQGTCPHARLLINFGRRPQRQHVAQGRCSPQLRGATHLIFAYLRGCAPPRSTRRTQY